MASMVTIDLVREVEVSLVSNGIDPDLLPVNFIEKCLRHASGNVKHSTMVCKKFLDFRKRVNWPTCLELQDINQGALRSGMYWVLGDKHGRAVFVFNPEHLDIKRCSIAEYQKMGMYLMEQLIQPLQVQDHGIAVVFDCRRINVRKIFAMIRYEDANRGLEMWQDAFPCRLRAIIIIGLSSATANFIKIVLKFLPKRVRDKISFLTMEAAAIELGVENVPSSMQGVLDLNLERLNLKTKDGLSTEEMNEDTQQDQNECMQRKTLKSVNDTLVSVGEVCEGGGGGDVETLNTISVTQEWNWGVIVDNHIAQGGQLFELNKPPNDCPRYDHNFS